MATLKGRRIAIVSVLAVVLLGGLLAWMGRDRNQEERPERPTTSPASEQGTPPAADSQTAENAVTRLSGAAGEPATPTDASAKESTVEDQGSCPPIESAQDKMRFRAFVESVLSREESGSIGGDGRLVDFSLQVTDGNELLVHYDGEDWSHAFSSPILGVATDVVITEDGAIHRLQMEERRVTLFACEMLEALDRCVEVQNLIADGDVEGARRYAGKYFEVIDTEKEFGTDEVFQRGPFNVKAFAMRKAEGSLGVTSFGVSGDGALALSNWWAVFYLYRQDGDWKIARGYMRPDH